MIDDANDRFDELLAEAARTYNRPPNEHAMPLDAIWASIEAQSFASSRHPPRYAMWLGIAAALVIGVGIGRLSLSIGQRQPTAALASAQPPQSARARRAVATSNSLSQNFDPTTSRYLGQAAALLIALPTEASVGQPDQPFINRASDLLLTTRLLLDSPSGSDPAMRNLLEDLELVLVQVVRLEKERAPSRRTELELIQQALDQRDVIPRLRNAASEYASDD